MKRRINFRCSKGKNENSELDGGGSKIPNLSREEMILELEKGRRRFRTQKKEKKKSMK